MKAIFAHLLLGTALLSPSLFAAGFDPELLLAFAGRGSSVGWDYGVAKAAHEKFDTFGKPGKLVLSGSSSGVIPTSYFACYGFSKESIAQADRFFLTFDKNVVNESKRKAREILFGRRFGYSHYVTEYPHEVLSEVLEKAVPPDCVPKLPFVIVAANGEINDNRVYGPLGKWRPLQGAGVKQFDPVTHDVRVNGAIIGKACTYFVDRTMWDVLSRDAGRKCDLRLVENAQDMRTAVLASVSEPTYFPQYPEMEPQKVQPTHANGYSRPRYYEGGYVMCEVASDIRRAFPSLWALGTGRHNLAQKENDIVRKWCLVDCNRSLETERAAILQNGMDVRPPDWIWARMLNRELSVEAEVNLGYRTAIGAIDERRRMEQRR